MKTFIVVDSTTKEIWGIQQNVGNTIPDAPEGVDHIEVPDGDLAVVHSDSSKIYKWDAATSSIFTVDAPDNPES